MAFASGLYSAPLDTNTQAILDELGESASISVVCEHFDHWLRMVLQLGNVFTEVALITVGVLADGGPCRHGRQRGMHKEPVPPFTPPLRHAHRMISLARLRPEDEPDVSSRAIPAYCADGIHR